MSGAHDRRRDAEATEAFRLLDSNRHATHVLLARGPDGWTATVVTEDDDGDEVETEAEDDICPAQAMRMVLEKVQP